MKQLIQPTVFLYHGITSKGLGLPSNRDVGIDMYDVSIETLETQIKWLNDKGFSIGKIERNLLSLEDKKKVIFTFDHGEMNNFTYAFPLLQKYHCHAYFFIIGEKVGKPGYMGWKELKEMHEAGMTIGSHSLTNEILTDLLETQMEEELLASKRYLEKNLNITVDSFSVPRGFCNERIIKKAHEIGYKNVFVLDKSSNIQSPCYERIAIKKKWDIHRFSREVEGKKLFFEKLGNLFYTC